MVVFKYFTKKGWQDGSEVKRVDTKSDGLRWSHRIHTVEGNNFHVLTSDLYACTVACTY